MVAKKWFICILFIIPLTLQTNPNKNLYVVEGTLINSGLLLRTKDGIVEFVSHSFSQEFADNNTKRIRILCSKSGNKCKPLRYDTEPFFDDEGVPDWTLKPLPTYITRGEFAFNPQVSPEGDKMFWTTLVSKGQGRSTQKIWTSEKDEFGFWKTGWQMEAPLNNQMPSAVISVLPGGNELFVFGNFGEEELMNGLEHEMREKLEKIQEESKDKKEFEYKLNQLRKEHKLKSERIFNRVPLYKSYRTKTYWSEPQPINFPSFYNTYKKENNPNQQVFGGSALSSSGKILIFSAQQKANYGKLDLYVSFMDEQGVFGEAINMGNVINTPEEEMAPFLAPDDRTLYFSSNGHGNGEDLSIFVTKRIGDSWTQWTKPVEISSKLRKVNFFSIPASSKWAYVSKEGQLYMAKIPEEYRPENVVVVKGLVKDDQGKPLEATIIYESLTKKKSLGRGISDPLLGNFSLVLPYGDNYGFFVEKKGYLPVSVNLNLTDSNNNYNGMEKYIEIVLPKIQVGQELTLNNLFFETGKSDLQEESEQELKRIIKVLNENPKIKILLEGHTDAIGTDVYNQKLSEARAESVKNYIIQNGNINPDRIQIIGYGSKKPIADNDTDENRAKNRRVVFRIIE